MKPAALEALLFVYGEPLSMEKAAKIAGCSVKDVVQAAAALEKELQTEERGLGLIIHQEQLQLVTKAEYSQLVEKVIKEEYGSDLSPALLETLAIIAYNGPISKAKIEHIRGVNSTFTIRRLLIRGLIEKTKEGYSASVNLLRHLGLKDIQQLPDYDKYNNLL